MALADDLQEIGQKVRQVYQQYHEPLVIQIMVQPGSVVFAVWARNIEISKGSAEQVIATLDAALGGTEGARELVNRARKQTLQQRIADDQAEIAKIDTALSEQ